MTREELVLSFEVSLSIDLVRMSQRLVDCRAGSCFKYVLTFSERVQMCNTLTPGLGGCDFLSGCKILTHSAVSDSFS